MRLDDHARNELERIGATPERIEEVVKAMRVFMSGGR